MADILVIEDEDNIATALDFLLTRDGHMDNVEIRCELQHALSGKLPANEIQTISKELQHRIKTNIGVSTKITVMEFDAIPRTQVGKAKRVLDERPKQN